MKRILIQLATFAALLLAPAFCFGQSFTFDTGGMIAQDLGLTNNPAPDWLGTLGQIEVNASAGWIAEELSLAVGQTTITSRAGSVLQGSNTNSHFGGTIQKSGMAVGAQIDWNYTADDFGMICLNYSITLSFLGSKSWSGSIRTSANARCFSPGININNVGNYYTIVGSGVGNNVFGEYGPWVIIAVPTQRGYWDGSTYYVYAENVYVLWVFPQTTNANSGDYKPIVKSQDN